MRKDALCLAAAVVVATLWLAVGPADNGFA